MQNVAPPGGWPVKPGGPNRKPLLLIPAAFALVCVVSILVASNNARTRQRQERVAQAWQQQQLAAAHAQQPIVAPQSLAIPSAPATGITANYADPENQRVARLVLNAAQNNDALVVVDVAVARAGSEVIATVAALDERTTTAEMRAVSLCMSLMNGNTELAEVSRFIINGASGVRLADGFRAQGRCFTASTSVWQRL